MREELFFDGQARERKLSRFWLLLLLAGVIASAGVVGDSTATVIGAMIVAPLMTPILGLALSIRLADLPNIRRSLTLVLAGSTAVVAIGFIFGLAVKWNVVASSNSQVAARVAPHLIDLIAALATGAVGAVALARDDISDTLPGVAIAISLVPPLAVVGLTASAKAWSEAGGSLLLFTTNVAAILASGSIVFALYRVRADLPGVADAPTPLTRRLGVVAIGVVLVLLTIPLTRATISRSTSLVTTQQVSQVAGPWARSFGGAVQSVTASGTTVIVAVVSPTDSPDITALRQQLEDAGLGRLKVRVGVIKEVVQDVTGSSPP